MSLPLVSFGDTGKKAAVKMLVKLIAAYSAHSHFLNFYSIDGGWGEWSDWDTCTVTCGGGSQTHTRFCDSPPPSNNGQDCDGDDTETQNCNEQSCVSGNK